LFSAVAWFDDVVVDVSVMATELKKMANIEGMAREGYLYASFQLLLCYMSKAERREIEKREKRERERVE
jgi:uncharacterized protein YqgQ